MNAVERIELGEVCSEADVSKDSICYNFQSTQGIDGRSSLKSSLRK